MRQTIVVALGVFLGLLLYELHGRYQAYQAIRQFEQQIAAPVTVPAKPRVPLAAGQQCIAGTVVERTRQVDGTPAAFQPLEFGKPIRCVEGFRAQ